jgi:hypothetical protein
MGMIMVGIRPKSNLKNGRCDKTPWDSSSKSIDYAFKEQMGLISK